jgi:hypothetical protein
MSNQTSNIDYLKIEGIAGSWCVVEHCGVSTKAEIKESEIRLSVSNAKGANWHSELRYGPFAVSEGDVYDISFETKAKIDFGFSVWLGQFDNPYAALIADANHFGEEVASSSWTHFNHQWVVAKSEARARLVFVVGPIDNIVEFRDIKLSKRVN